LVGFEAIVLQLLGRDADADDEAVTDAAAHRAQALDEKPHPVLARAAVPIRPQIGLGVEKLREEKAMARDQLDTVEPRLGQAVSRRAARLDQFLDEAERHG